MKEAFAFLNDYVTCIAGDEESCSVISDFALRMARHGGIPTTLYAGIYTSAKILKMAEMVAANPTKYASDSFYAREIEKQWGGKEVDQFIQKNGKTPAEALEKASKELETLKSKADSKSELRAKGLEEMKKKLESRISLERSNQAALETALKETSHINSQIMEKVIVLDSKIQELDQNLRTATSGSREELKNSLKALKEQRKKFLDGFQQLETRSKPPGEGFNQSVNKLIENLKTRSDGFKPSNETIQFLEKKKIKIPSDPPSRVTRYILRITDDGYSLIDVNGPYKKLPKWSQELRKSAVRELPDIIMKAAKDGIQDPKKELMRLAELEHERWRKKTQKDLIESYEQRRRVFSTIGEEAKDVKFPRHADGSLNYEARLNPTQREALKSLKKNWLDTDKPFSQLSPEYQNMTAKGVAENLLKTQMWSEEKGFSRLAKFLFKRPILGKLASKAIKYGPGYAVGGLLFAFDAISLREDALALGFQSETVRNLLWSATSAQCRMPKQTALESPDTTDEYSKWFCNCETEERRADTLHEMCQSAPSEMKDSTKQLCQIARSSGRDRDLQIARKYRQLPPNEQETNALFKSAVGCDVMMNYPSHCRWSTSDLTDQGLYFMNLIEMNNLHGPIAELCPDVCSHWLKVAKEKIRQLGVLKEIESLPKTESENKSPGNCDQSQKPPPENFEKWKTWRSCQKTILCDGNSGIRLNLPGRNLESYQMTYDPRTKNVRSIQLIQHQIQNKLSSSNHSYNKVETKKNFEYQFDAEGQMTKLNLFNFTAANELSESVPVEDLISKFNDAAYNANSTRIMKYQPELALNRRIESFLLARSAIQYCCATQGHCATSEEPMDSQDFSSLGKPQAPRSEK